LHGCTHTALFAAARAIFSNLPPLVAISNAGLVWSCCKGLIPREASLRQEPYQYHPSPPLPSHPIYAL
jgi:hypothetical protein